LFEQFRKRVLGLDPSITESVRKLYIAYKASSNFVEVVALKSGLRLFLDVEQGTLDDPKGLCRNLSDIGHWGTGQIEVRLNTVEQLTAVMALVRQSYELNSDDLSA